MNEHLIILEDDLDAFKEAQTDNQRPTEATRHPWYVFAILSTLMGFASISTDLYLPAMPVMGRSLGASTGQIEWTVSGYLIGFSLGQLLWGPVGDRWGRRLPIAIGIMLFIIGSAGCAMADSAAVLIGWRVIQAMGACAGVTLARAMVRDLYDGDQAAHMMSILMIIMAIAPLIGPLLGGQILTFAGWRAIFWVLVVVGLVTLLSLIVLPETHPEIKRTREPLFQSLLRYKELLSQRRLLAYSGAGGFFYGGMFAYIAGTPFAYINYYHVSPQAYGLLFGLGVVGIMATNFFNTRLLLRFGSTRLLLLGTGLAAVAGMMLAFAAKTGFLGIAGLVIPLFLFVSMTGFIVANSIAGALSNFPERAGAVSALVGAMQYGSGIIGSALVGAFADGTPWPMGAVIALTGIGSFLCARVLVSGIDPLQGKECDRFKP